MKNNINLINRISNSVENHFLILCINKLHIMWLSQAVGHTASRREAIRFFIGNDGWHTLVLACS